MGKNKKQLFTKKQLSVIVLIVYLIAVIIASATPGKSDDEFIAKLKSVLLQLAFIEPGDADNA